MKTLTQVTSAPPTPPPVKALLVFCLAMLFINVLLQVVPAAGSWRATNPHQAASRDWRPPVEHATAADVLKAFHRPDQPWSAAHRGIDLRAGPADVVAPNGGVVKFVGVVVDRPVLTIEHPNGLLSSFEPVESELTVGASVATGELLGTISPDVAHCAIQCVHWGVRIPNAWQIGTTVRDLYIDPAFLLGWTEPSVLWPIYSEP